MNPNNSVGGHLSTAQRVTIPPTEADRLLFKAERLVELLEEIATTDARALAMAHELLCEHDIEFPTRNCGVSAAVHALRRCLLQLHEQAR